MMKTINLTKFLRPLIERKIFCTIDRHKCVRPIVFQLSHHNIHTCSCTHKSSTHFGYQTVSPEEKSQKVNEVFRTVADKYDLMNDVMSVGIHRIWKEYFIRSLNPMKNTRLLDVAGGTGDVAFKFLEHVRSRGDTESSVVVCDVNEDMLRVGRERGKQMGHIDDESGISWVQGDAMKLPFEDDSFDAYTIAFGMRNVVDIECALNEAHRVLRPGGIFACLEFSQMKIPLLDNLYTWYSFNVIPVLGQLIAGDYHSYQYLVESIRKFPDQDDYKAMISDAGFSLVSYENLSNGIAAIHMGYKK